MPGSIISLHVGQCGNQIGTEFWRTMCEEHGIGVDGALLQPHKIGEDRKELFFNEINMGTRFMPRSVLVDLEPRVINQIKSSEIRQLHNHGNMFTSANGGGAGNNWASGYSQSGECVEEIFDIINREAENADSLDGFVLSHSISGGTGSGLGSKMLEQLKGRFPKTILQTFSVFSDIKDSADVVVAPYNSILTVDCLVEHPDVVVVLDNQALYRVAMETMRVQTPSLEDINSMVSRIMSSSTATMRFYSPLYTRLSHIAAYVNPFPPMQFIQTAYAPFLPPDNKYVVNTSAERVLARILEPKSLISSAKYVPSKVAHGEGSPPPKPIQHSMLSALAIVQTDVKNQGARLSNGIRQQIQRNNIIYPPWSSTALSVASCNLSPYKEHQYEASGVLLANHTNVSIMLREMNHQFDKLRKRNAFKDRFERELPNVSEMMDASREKVGELVRLYEEATTMKFMPDFDATDASGSSPPSMPGNGSESCDTI